MATVLLALVHVVTVWACPAVPTPGRTAGTGGTAEVEAGYAAERRLCVELTNRFRASAGEAPLGVSPGLERYAADAAAEDGRARRAHGHFHRTGGGGVARAENLVPWWPLSEFESVTGIVVAGLGMMWAEGPRGEHRRNMEGRYTEVGCGVFVEGGEVTVVVAFR